MPPTTISLSPAELSYIHTSLAQTPPIRPDGRTPTQFRPLVAETDILPSANGSARICFADGTEAVVGVKAEVERSADGAVSAGVRAGGKGLGTGGTGGAFGDVEMGVGDDDDDDDDEEEEQRKGEDTWVEIAVDVPGFRDDDSLPVFLAAMLTESLLADGELKDRLYINRRFHWRLYVDILLLSSPLSYPLPLLSLTTHLALLQTRLPALISEKDEDPLFNDDWDAATALYPADSASKPPITLLVMTAGTNIIFDPSRDELAVAASVLAISVAQVKSSSASSAKELRVIALRAVDPPSRMTTPGVPNSMDSVTGGAAPTSKQQGLEMREKADAQNIWRPPRGGFQRELLKEAVRMIVMQGGVGHEVLEALQAVDT